jgi:hypothetical protein
MVSDNKLKIRNWDRHRALHHGWDHGMYDLRLLGKLYDIWKSNPSSWFGQSPCWGFLPDESFGPPEKFGCGGMFTECAETVEQEERYDPNMIKLIRNIFNLLCGSILDTYLLDI